MYTARLVRVIVEGQSAVTEKNNFRFSVKTST